MTYCSRDCYAPKTDPELGKKCKVCGIVKDLDHFYKSNRYRLGVESTCVACHKKPKVKRIKKSKTSLKRLKENTRSLIWHQTKKGGYKKNGRSYEIIGADYDFYKKYIEDQFQLGMTWDNYSVTGWTIDHICPAAQALNTEEFNKLQHYTNCRPMWHKENISKGDRYTEEADSMCKKLLGRDWIGFKGEKHPKKDLFLVTGVSGAGKSWILSRITNPSMHIIDSDLFPKKDIILACWDSKKLPVLALTSGISTFIKNQSHRFNIQLIIIIEDEGTIRHNLTNRGGSFTNSIKTRISRMNSLAKRAIFTGTSNQILDYLNTYTLNADLARVYHIFQT